MRSLEGLQNLINTSQFAAGRPWSMTVAETETSPGHEKLFFKQKWT